MKEFFEGVKAKIHPPPEEKVDPVKAKRTLDALRKPPKSPPRTNYERITEQKYLEAERSGSTVSDKRLKERAAGKKIAQLGEQANQSCPPLNVSSDIVANAPGMVPGYSNLGDITCPTMYIMISWRWTNTDTSTGSLSSKMKNL